jgi:hypothetical protein
LCEVMRTQIEGSRARGEFELRSVDIDTDAVLQERFDRSIPVLEIGGHIAFKGRLETAEFERKFARLAEDWRKQRALGIAVPTPRERA